MKTLMKPLITLVLASFAAINLCHAGTPISVAELPAPVIATLEDYFPNATLLSAEQEKDKDQWEYEVKIAYKDIRLEVELTQDGVITDLDLKR